MVRIGGGRAFGVSADGAVVVGEAPGAELSGDPKGSPEAYRWEAAGGMLGLGFAGYRGLAPHRSTARDVSADGSVVVGFMEVELDESWLGFRWTASGGAIRSSPAIVEAVSSDGSILVGQHFNWDNGFGSYGYWPREATVKLVGSYHEIGFLHPLFDPSQDIRESGALGVSDAGLVVGWSCSPPPGPGDCDAFLWDERNGMRVLKQVLEAETGLDLDGWDLSTASDITPDGLTIVGNGFDPQGRPQAWIVVVPEPGTAGLLALGLAALAVRRRPVARPHGRS
jgi:uncharacterized membrane protein